MIRPVVSIVLCGNVNRFATRQHVAAIVATIEDSGCLEAATRAIPCS